MPAPIATIEDLEKFGADLLKNIAEMIDRKVSPRILDDRVKLSDAAKHFKCSVKTFRTYGIQIHYAQPEQQRGPYVLRKDIDARDEQSHSGKQNLNPIRK